MRMRSKVLILVLGVALVASGMYASNFRVADTIYMLGAIYSKGASGFFDTDVVIWNPNDVSVDVDIAFMRTGNVDNRNLTDVKSVGPIAAHGVLNLDSIIDGTFGEKGFGHLLFFSCKTGGDCSNCDSNPADCAPIAVEGRVFNILDETADPPPTTGQLFNGFPWFSYASIDEAARNLDEVWILGIRQEGSVGVSGYRSNIGLVNSSQFSSTTLRVTLYDAATGTQFGSPYEISLNPLAHVQLGLTQMFPGFEGRAYAKVEQVGVVATGDPDFPDGAPGFFAYGAANDNLTGDPTTLEAIYPTSDPYLQVFATGKTGIGAPKRTVRRPVVNH